MDSRKVTKGILFPLVAMLALGCENIDILEQQIKPGNNVETTRCSANLQAQYLTISSLNPQDWSYDEYLDINAAVERIGVSFSHEKNIYEFQVSSGNEVNMSDSMYSVVTKLFEHTNYVFNISDRKKVRRKAENSEWNYILPDCVPAAVSHMGIGAPSYSDAIAKCDQLFPNWRSQGGVPTAKVWDYVKLYAPVFQFSDMSYWNVPIMNLNNLVMIFSSSRYTHAVNAYKMGKIGSYCIIYYHDFSASSVGDGAIMEGQMNYIYPFVSLFHASK